VKKPDVDSKNIKQASPFIKA